MAEQTKELNEVEEQGLLRQSLNRTNAEIRQERGEVIYEDLNLEYKRRIEDVLRSITRAQRERRNQFDFSPTNSQSLVMGKDFDAGEVLDKDTAKSLEIRKLKVKFNIAVSRYNTLFGPTYKTIDVESEEEIKIEKLEA